MKQIKLLLTENVDNLGIVGDVVDVKPGYARNYLLPRGIGTQPTKGNIARLAGRRQEVEQQLRRQRAEEEKLIGELEGVEITMQRSANEQGVLFGGVSQHEIAEALRDEGFKLDDRAVRIGEQIKRLDSYDIPIVLAQDLKTEIKLWIVSDKLAEELDAEAAEGESEGGDESGDEQEQVPAEVE